MVVWTNRAVYQFPRNDGDNTTTVDPTSATNLVSGATFTPTSGRLLVAVIEGSVTSSTPTDWTLPTNGSAINNTGLYVWHRTAASGSNAFTTTHNAADYPIGFVIYEFPAGSTFVKSVSAINVPVNSANPNLTGLTGTNLVMGVVAGGVGAIGTAGPTAWSGTGSPVEDLDLVVTKPTGGSTDGYVLSVGYVEGFTGTSWQPTGTVTAGTSTVPNKECLTFAVNVATGGGTTHAAAGTVAVTVGAAGAITARLAVAGVVPVLVGAIGNATRVPIVHQVSGVVPVVVGTAGTVRAILATAGIVPVLTTAAGAATVITGAVVHQVSGTVAVLTTTAGTISRTQSASGVVPVLTTTSGAATRVPVTHQVSGTVAVLTGAAGSALPGGGFSGTVVVLTTVSGTVSARRAVAGTVPVSVGVAGTVSQRHQVSGTVAVHTAVQGAVSLRHNLSGTVAVTTATGGAVTVVSGAIIHQVSGVVAVHTDVLGQPTALLRVAGTVAVLTTVRGTVSGGTSGGNFPCPPIELYPSAPVLDLVGSAPVLTLEGVSCKVP